MTDVIMVHTPPRISSISSSIDNDVLHQEVITSVPTSPVVVYRRNTCIQEAEEEEEEEGSRERKKKRREKEEGDQVSILAVLVTVFRKSLVACKSVEGGIEEKLSSSSSSSCSNRMEISWPNDVRHVAHVTFDRFNGFLGLPVEFEPEVPRRPPSASIRVFGVSTESMQLSFDSRGNSVPTILLMMQRRLYSHGGLQAEGIFRINAENAQEEYVREHLNRGVVPDDIDVHCLAGLIKAWFRELPRGILDSLSHDEVMQAQTEEECVRLVRFLPPTEAALLDWAINLMADVAQFEQHNKMNARNIAMVFAPNMTQMADPLTALMYAVQVMNFLKTLITRTLREREDSIVEAGPAPDTEPSDENGRYGSSQPIVRGNVKVDVQEEDFIAKKPLSDADSHSTPGELNISNKSPGFLGSIENILADGKGHIGDKFKSEILNAEKMNGGLGRGDVIGRGKAQSRNQRPATGQSSVSDLKKGTKKVNQKPVVRGGRNIEKSRDSSIISRLNSQTERVEAWR